MCGSSRFAHRRHLQSEGFGIDLWCWRLYQTEVGDLARNACTKINRTGGIEAWAHVCAGRPIKRGWPGVARVWRVVWFVGNQAVRMVAEDLNNWSTGHVPGAYGRTGLSPSHQLMQSLGIAGRPLDGKSGRLRSSPFTTPPTPTSTLTFCFDNQPNFACVERNTYALRQWSPNLNSTFK
ncbi:hypothetical protein BDV93DRAFT_515709 [Ceratobasidium sp. AG-I]|nr:hypothetical protein BDV93DRAFT_515709 [Ceratobasidium sp. AG-I]